MTELRIANRTRVRAEQIKAEFGAKVVVHDWAQAGNMLEGAMTVVNATSMGMEGKPPCACRWMRWRRARWSPIWSIRR